MLRKISLSLLTALPLFALDVMEPSTTPPGGLHPSQVPQFVVIGSDDNGRIDGLTWFTELLESIENPDTENNQLATFDGEPASASLYVASNVLHQDSICTLLKRLYANGIEISNHTDLHKGSVEFDAESGALTKRLTVEEYTVEIKNCTDKLVEKLGIPAESIKGFRTPYAAYNDTALQVVENLGMLYDCTIMSGHETWEGIGEVGTFFWPYTLENGSPSTAQTWYNTHHNLPVGSHPGVWEMPYYAFDVPADDECESYGTTSGLQERAGGHISWSDGTSVDGIDYNLWAQYQLDKEDVLAILKYNLDKMYKGNRSPMHYVIHSDFYTDDSYYSDGFTSIPDYLDRRAIIEEFLEYALTLPDVRIVSSLDVIDWMKNPVALSKSTSIHTKEVTKNSLLFSNSSVGKLGISTSHSGLYTVSIMDLRGRVVMEMQSELTAGVNEIDISSLHLSNQISIVAVKGSEGFSNTQRMLLK